MHFSLVGHSGCHNRGCEAILRSTAAILEDQFGPCLFTVSSARPNVDLPLADNINFRFVDRTIPEGRFNFVRLNRLARRLPMGRCCQPLLARLPDAFSACLSVGGDNFSLDYGRPWRFVRDGQRILDARLPFVIWGASIGPFTKQPEFETQMRSFLQKVSLITARESVTVAYLRSLGVTRNVVQTYDPAFALQPEPIEGPIAEFLENGDVVGLNASVLLARWSHESDASRLQQDLRAFVSSLRADGFRILLVPHVVLPDGPADQNDEAFLEGLVESDDGGQMALVPGSWNAAKLKAAIAKCRLFIGARTHATIAALSSAVPTLFLAYSSKATGMCRDVFGTDQWLVPPEQFTVARLRDSWTRLCENEDDIRRTLVQKQPEMIAGAQRNATALAEVIAGRGP